MDKQRNTPNRLVVDVPKELHADIKIRAIAQGTTLRRWVLKAIAARIKEEESYNNKMKE
jgi:predicted HicB family RNase H-like nuclease